MHHQRVAEYKLFAIWATANSEEGGGGVLSGSTFIITGVDRVFTALKISTRCPFVLLQRWAVDKTAA